MRNKSLALLLVLALVALMYTEYYDNEDMGTTFAVYID